MKTAHCNTCDCFLAEDGLCNLPAASSSPEPCPECGAVCCLTEGNGYATTCFECGGRVGDWGDSGREG